ncbi:myosin-10-like isoform X4 [Pomacea canaliculata]|uniref:myosin-10-like isoform X4 n=1 Tax=Pomacea canaliculata TaxID=400727 RepID=UPI000D734722|nr:myosin-10-like isoform X4 [Pomacea canaliculata]
MMNYVGSISILDRGDAPAQAVIDRNARSMAQRIADETKDELEKVMTRVENIYSSFEMTENMHATSNVEYLQNIGELEEIMKDQVKKKKYQHQVTIFIVGFSEVSGQKLRLLQQVNEFFTENSKKIDDEDWFPTTPDMDLDDVSEKIEDGLHVAQELSRRLGDLHKDMVEYMATYAEKKASNKLTQMMEGKGKKKLEKSLLQAKEEVQTLAEKLLGVQTELQEKDEKLQSTFKQLESKNLEVQKFRTAAELAKKAVQDTEALQEQIAARDAKINEQRQHITRLEIDLAQSNHMTERSQTRLTSMGEESQQKIVLVQKELEEQKRMTEDIKRDLTKLYEDQIAALTEAHHKELEEIKKQHATQIHSLTEELQQARQEAATTQHYLLQLQVQTNNEDDGAADTQSETGRQFDLDSETSIDGISRQSSKQESRPSTKEAKSSKKKSSSKSPARTPGGKDGKGSRASGAGAKTDSDSSGEETSEYPDSGHTKVERRADKEFAEIAVQDEGGDAAAAVVEESRSKEATARHSKRSALEPVHEFHDSEDAFSLTDEESWAQVPKERVEGRFAQYRRLAQQRLRELEDQKQLTIAKTTRKVQLLKAQFVEHKNKWEAERKILIEQVEQAHRLQNDAEKEADAALTQLEDFITEQEQLEEQEETRRSAILRGTSDASLTTGQTPIPRTPGPPPQTPGTASVSPAHPTPPESQASEDLHNLMQQTDDAKVAERNAHARDPGTMSAPPNIDSTASAVEGMKKEDDATQKASSATPTALAKTQDQLPSDLSKGSDLTSPHLPYTPLATTLSSSVQEITEEKQATDAETKASQTEGENEEFATLKRKSNVGEETVQAPRDKSMSLTRDASKDTEALSGKSPDGATRLEGSSEDELRELSARRRAQLRDVYKTRLVGARQAAEDRRANTPLITIPTREALEDDLVDEEEQDDVALPDELKEEVEEQKRLKELSHYDIGTSPPPGSKAPSSRDMKLPSRKSTLLEHPLLQEYLKVYEGVVSFKDTMARSFLDKDMMSASQILADLETLVFDKEKPVLSQVEHHTTNILYVLEEIAGVVNSVVLNDREPPVSSLLPLSRDESRLPPTRETSEVYPSHSAAQTASSFTNPDRTHVHVDAYMRLDGAGRRTSTELHGAGGVSRTGSHQSSLSGTGRQQLADLQEQYILLQQQLQEDSRKHEEQLRHNTVVMMEMQDTINELQRELSTLGKTTKKSRSASSSNQVAPSPDMSLMFTRLDLERNAKIMKKAVLDQRLSSVKYKEAVSTMDEYVSLPAQRLAHLVRKYVHHSRMKQIEDNVKSSPAVDEQVFDTLDKMEVLQNQRARKWADKMDQMGLERLRLAAMLMDSLDNIEEESGLFLIKPMYSFKGRELKVPVTQKLTRPVRMQPASRQQSAAQESTAPFVPAPTPASNVRRLDRHTPVNQAAGEMTFMPPPPPSRPEDGVVGSVAIRNMGASHTPLLVHSHQTWNLPSSRAGLSKDSSASLLNTPRMLELDINRMLIGQNNISAKLPHALTDDRLVNVSNNNLRSYVTVHRPTAPLSGGDQQSLAAGDTAVLTPPSSVTPRPPLAVSPADRDIPPSLNPATPLPPIAGDQAVASIPCDPEGQ